MLLTNILPYKRYSLFLSSLVGPQEFSVPLPYTVITRPEFASRPCGSGKRDAKKSNMLRSLQCFGYRFSTFWLTLSNNTAYNYKV